MLEELLSFRKSFFPFFIIISFSILFSPLVSAAINYYVRTDGSDTLCSGLVNQAQGIDNPNCAFQTIQKAVNTASSGDTINVAAGTYVEAVSVTKSLTLKGASGAIIKPDGTTPLLDGGVRCVAVYINAVDGVTIDGFEIDGTSNVVNLGIYGFNSDNTIVKNNVVHNMIDDSAHVSGIGIIFYGWGQGINDVLIQGNTVSYTDHHGIWIGAVETDGITPKVSNNNVIEDNIVHHTWQNTVVAPALWGGAIGMDAAQNGIIHGNHIYNTGWNQRDIMLINGADSVTIDDNILEHSNGAQAFTDGWMQPAIDIFPPSNDMIITNNDITVNIESSSAYGWAVWLPDVTGTSIFNNNIITLAGSSQDVHGLVLNYNPGVPPYSGLPGSWTIQGNTFQGSNLGTSSTAIRLYADNPGASHIDIIGNTINGWTNGIRSSMTNTGNVIVHQNSITSNSAYGFLDDGPSTVPINAENNWWGSNTGPSDPTGTTEVPPCTGDPTTEMNADGTGNDVSGNVDFCPWLTLDLTLTSPEENKVYNIRSILIDASTSLKADKIEYSDNDPIFRRLCSNCNSYSRKKSFSEGNHVFTVKATLGSETVSKTVNFFVDSTPPRIIKILPEDEDIIHGTTFYIKYTEANLMNVSLYLKESTQSTYQQKTNYTCEKGTNKECTLTVDLTGYDGKMINFYFDVRDPANTFTSSVRTITIDDTNPLVTINSPEDKKYSSRRIDLDVGVDETVEKLEYSLDGIRFNRLCNNCKSYKRMTNFNDGDYTLVVRATDYAGNVGQLPRHFFVDSIPPRIIRQYPQDKKYTNGTFTITYTEQNLNKITLYYKGFSETEYKSSPENPCEPGTNKECVFYVDLTSYDGKQINYYFVVQNGVGETTGKIYTVNVDTKIPNIEKIYSPENGKTYYLRRVQLDIKVDEPVELEYSDNGGIKFTRLCSRCDSYNRTHTFSYGWHGLVIRATDNADNTVTKPVEFWVVKNLS